MTKLGIVYVSPDYASVQTDTEGNEIPHPLTEMFIVRSSALNKVGNESVKRTVEGSVNCDCSALTIYRLTGNRRITTADKKFLENNPNAAPQTHEIGSLQDAVMLVCSAARMAASESVADIVGAAEFIETGPTPKSRILSAFANGDANLAFAIMTETETDHDTVQGWLAEAAAVSSEPDDDDDDETESEDSDDDDETESDDDES